MVQTNEFERDLTDQTQLKRPGRVDMVVFQNIPDAGDGSPGIQRCFRNYLHEGGMEKDIDINSHDIKNVINVTMSGDINITGELVFPSATLHSSGTEIHVHPNTGNADGNLILHPVGSNTASLIFVRNSVTGNYGDFIIKVSGTVASLESGLGGGGTAPDTLNINDPDWDNINIGDASASINMNAVDISATQFGYVGAMNQGVTQSSNVNFGQITMSGDIIMGSDDITFSAGGTVDGVDVSAHDHSGGDKGVAVPFTSLSGDIVYGQLDSIVDTSGGGASSLISRANHLHTASDGSSKIAHVNTTGRTTNDHHNQSHNLTSHSTRAHSELTSVTTDQHHAQSHSHDTQTLQLDNINSNGGTFDFQTSGVLNLKVSGDNGDYIQVSSDGTNPKIKAIGGGVFELDTDGGFHRLRVNGTIIHTTTNILFYPEADKVFDMGISVVNRIDEIYADNFNTEGPKYIEPTGLYARYKAMELVPHNTKKTSVGDIEIDTSKLITEITQPERYSKQYDRKFVSKLSDILSLDMDTARDFCMNTYKKREDCPNELKGAWRKPPIDLNPDDYGTSLNQWILVNSMIIKELMNKNEDLENRINYLEGN